MIFVTVGSQDKPFTRLIKEVDRLVDENVIKGKVIVQAGSTKLRNTKLKLFDFLSIDDFQKYMNDCNLVITHGGVGTILDALKRGKKVIAVPRDAKYSEIANDHQKQIIEEFDKMGYIIGCQSVKDLEQALGRVEEFKPKRYLSNNKKFVSLIEDFIDNNI